MHGENMHNEFRPDTKDLIALGRKHRAEVDLDPQERENAVQATGRRHRRTGISILVSVFVGALSCAVAAENRIFYNAAAQLLAALSMFALIVVGGLLASSGFNERNNRPLRSMTRLEVVQSSENTERLELLLKGNDDLAGQFRDVKDRLVKIEKVVEQVPKYGEAVLDGFELGRSRGGDDDRV